ncbi:MAG: hypothetical protein COW03_02220 [Cytophagales bacterium CG12_big_fil_rev_8_21_14_0_65_40_12]|nr:MAG: hypothetical protein COW03_02220 [Cytophagales bacterium CG12_big_fil_rev_8_21_14_0_65_40_12]PIW05163.1 MAG: hypothetical protein COW40_06075 [Cytophagales bacterium CG17_big_fil_post_rev_8_21_14_2_50_40_13]
MVNMKNLLLSIGLIIALSSCDVVYVEEVIVDDREFFTGRYDVEEYSETLNQTTSYNLRVLKEGNSRSNVVFLDNFYGVGIEVFAEVYGGGLRIPRQIVNDYRIQGVGHIDRGDLVMTYSVEDLRSVSGFTDFCNTIAYRR